MLMGSGSLVLDDSRTRMVPRLPGGKKSCELASAGDEAEGGLMAGLIDAPTVPLPRTTVTTSPDSNGNK